MARAKQPVSVDDIEFDALIDSEEGYEADDIIGSMAKCCNDIQTTILTSDRDLLQLIDSSTHVLLMKKGLSEM